MQNRTLLNVVFWNNCSKLMSCRTVRFIRTDKIERKPDVSWSEKRAHKEYLEEIVTNLRLCSNSLGQTFVCEKIRGLVPNN